VSARGATLCLSFDNLGEAAEIELGAAPAGAPPAAHPTVTTALPAILEALDSRGIAASFFVEGLNAELYPEALLEIDAGGHEVAYHAWRHEQWGELDETAQAENLGRGLAAFERLGLEARGFRPPGGVLGAGGLRVLREAGLRYCSPEGKGARAEEGLAVLPFEWRHVDASCVLADLGPPREPGDFVAFLEDELQRLARDGGLLTVILHPFMLDWLGAERLDGLLDAVAAARQRGELRACRCEEAAEGLLSDS
jgi:peptidoglycan/xylan/chitin deacetylase (PgdA/CDA1 family)